jgi:hypothetical protein
LRQTHKEHRFVLDGGFNYTNLSHSREISRFFDPRQTIQKWTQKGLDSEISNYLPENGKIAMKYSA